MLSEDFKNISGNNDHDREQLENQYDHTKSLKKRKKLVDTPQEIKHSLEFNI